ncbi:hypothetical protein EGW08_017913, partial [Elysia chlorotica]
MMKMCSALCFLVLVLILFVPGVTAVFDCKPGWWGKGCSQKCGHCIGGGAFCQVYDGYCMNGCASGYDGSLCTEKCKPHTYGPHCQEKCGKCDNGPCNPVTGHCDSGCKLGFQPPFCHSPCPFNTYGKDCAEKCDCPDGCGCSPLFGDCEPAGCTPEHLPKYNKDNPYPKCINQDQLDDLSKESAQRDVLEIPWLAMLSVILLLFVFVLGNFIWWWFMVRIPPPPMEDIMVDRSEKPDYIVDKQEESMLLARWRRKFAI